MATNETQTATIQPRPLWQRAVFRMLRLVLIIYVVAILVFASLQSKLIFDGAKSQGSPEAMFTPPGNMELVNLTAEDGTTIAALFARSHQSQSVPTIIFFYGNAMCLKDTLQDVRMFRDLGANVMAVEYAGYGLSGGTASEAGCYLAAETAYQWLLKRDDIDTTKIIPAGWSLGGAVAVDLAKRHAGEGRVCGLIILSTFTSLTDVGRTFYPFLPVSLILRHKFDSLAKIGGVGVPVFIGHGRYDVIAPFKMADQLAEAAEKAGLRVTRLTLDDTSHNDFFDVGQDRIEAALEKFLRELK